MPTRETKSKGAAERTPAASNGRTGSSNGDWRDRVQPPRITDPRGAPGGDQAGYQPDQDRYPARIDLVSPR